MKVARLLAVVAAGLVFGAAAFAQQQDGSQRYRPLPGQGRFERAQLAMESCHNRNALELRDCRARFTGDARAQCEGKARLLDDRCVADARRILAGDAPSRRKAKPPPRPAP
jgi:hypothetical protein